MNELAINTLNKNAVNQIYNTAYGDRTTLNDLVKIIQQELSVLDPNIADVKIIHGPNRIGDIPHSLASIEKAKNLLNYAPKFNLEAGLKEAILWYWKNLKQTV